MKIGELIKMVRGNIPKEHIAYINTSDEYIYNMLLVMRSRLLTQKSKKNQHISEWNYSFFPCVEVIKVPRITCKCLAHLSCETVSRTKHPLPKLISNADRTVIRWIRSVDGVNIPLTTSEQIQYSKGNKYAKIDKSLNAILEGPYIYLYGENIPKVISIKALVENLTELHNFPDYCKEDNDCEQPCLDCDDSEVSSSIYEECLSMYEREFDIDIDLVDALVALVRERIFNINYDNNNGSQNTDRGREDQDNQ